MVDEKCKDCFGNCSKKQKSELMHWITVIMVSLILVAIPLGFATMVCLFIGNLDLLFFLFLIFFAIELTVGEYLIAKEEISKEKEQEDVQSW